MPTDPAAPCVWAVLAPEITEVSCKIDWMKDRLLPSAISVGNELPPMRQRVIGWLSSPEVAIYFVEAVVWRTPGISGHADEWWSGLPGQYINLYKAKWRLSHWLPFVAAVNAQAASDDADVERVAELDAYYWNSIRAERDRLLAERRQLMARYATMERTSHPSKYGQGRLLLLNERAIAVLNRELSARAAIAAMKRVAP